MVWLTALAAKAKGAGIGAMQRGMGAMSGMRGIAAGKEISSAAYTAAGKPMTRVFEAMADKKAQKGAGETSKMFKALGSSATSFGLSLMIYAWEKMQWMTPWLEVWTSLWELLGGYLMLELLPVFQEFIAVVTDPKFTHALQVSAEIWGNILTPALQAIIFIIIVWVEVVWLVTHALSEGAEWLDKWAHLVGTINHAISVGGSPSLLQSLAWAATSVTILAIAFSPFISALGIIKSTIRDIINLIGRIPRIGGGGGGGGGGNGGNIIEDILGKIGLQGGTPYVPSTGLYYLHEGEEVIAAGESGSGGITVNLHGDMIKEDIIDYLVRELTKRKALGLF